MRYFVGIDVGKKGGIAIIGGGTSVDVFPYSDSKLLWLCKMIHDLRQEAVIFVERATARPKQGVTATFNFGAEYGYIRGVIEANKIPYEIVIPQKWKKQLGVTSDKSTSIELAKRLFPTVSLKRTSRCRVDSDGMAEALLIAEYGRRKNLSKKSTQTEHMVDVILTLC